MGGQTSRKKEQGREQGRDGESRGAGGKGKRGRGHGEGGGGGLNRVYLEAGTWVFTRLDTLARRYVAVTLGVRWMTSPGSNPST